jgi:hypothetical protein
MRIAAVIWLVNPPHFDYWSNGTPFEGKTVAMFDPKLSRLARQNAL